MRALRRSDRGCACRFCCAGCAAAYQIVTGLGLDRYYDGRLRLLWRGTPERARELLDLARSLGYRAVPLIEMLRESYEWLKAERLLD